jgi:hypothetical protein
MKSHCFVYKFNTQNYVTDFFGQVWKHARLKLKRQFSFFVVTKTLYYIIGAIPCHKHLLLKVLISQPNLKLKEVKLCWLCNGTSAL